ncbi:MAG: hypothetical protein WKF58_03365 [Ilumatobacteraceae bacterium]
MSEPQADEWTATLVAYVNGTLGDDERRRVDEALHESPTLRAELAAVRTIAAAASADEPPASVPDSVWARIDDGAGAPLPPPSNVVELRPHRRWILAAAAAAVAFVAAGVVVAQITSDDESDTASSLPAPGSTSAAPGTATPLTSPAPQALRSASREMLAARTARFEVSGEGTAHLENLLGRENVDVDIGIELTGEAAVNFADDGAYRFSTEFVGVSGPEIFRPERTTNDVIVVDGVRYSSSDGGPYETSDVGEADGALFSAIVLRPDLLSRLGDIAEGEIEDLGVERLDGVDVRRLRFDLDVDELQLGTESATAEVWIDESGAVQRARFVTADDIPDLDEAEEATVELTIDIDLVETGAGLEITAPS